MRFFYIFSFLIVSSFSLVGMEKPTSEIKQTTEKHHEPLLILIDQFNSESEKDIVVRSITANFIAGLQSNSFPILVSKSILLNFLRRKQTIVSIGSYFKNFALYQDALKTIEEIKKSLAGMESYPGVKEIIEETLTSLKPYEQSWEQEHQFLSSVNLTSTDWKLYVLNPDQAMFFLVPANYPLHNFNRAVLEEITYILPLTTEQNLEMVIDQIDRYQGINVLPSIISLFKQKKESPSTIWDIYINGHGSADMRALEIAGLLPAQLNKLLQFFNDMIITNVVNLSTCSIGGNNLDLVQWRKSGISRSFNYILVVESIDDSPTKLLYTQRMRLSGYLGNYFNNAKNLINKSDSLNKLVTDLIIKEPEYISNLPQVWLPGGIGFQTVALNNYVISIGLVKKRTHELSKKPIIVKDAMAILMYPLQITVPLHVYPQNLSLLSEEKFEWSDLSIKPIYNYLYPQFISMVHGNTIQQLQKVIVHKSSLATEKTESGVLHFIRDAFFNIAGRVSKKKVLINNLEGFNDIRNIIEKQRIQKSIEIPHELEQALQSEQIKLKKVIIKTKGNKQLGYKIRLSFKYKNSAWQFNVSKESLNAEPYAWYFKSKEVSTHKQQFTQLLEKLSQRHYQQELAPTKKYFYAQKFQPYLLINYDTILNLKPKEWIFIKDNKDYFPLLSTFINSLELLKSNESKFEFYKLLNNALELKIKHISERLLAKGIPAVDVSSWAATYREIYMSQSYLLKGILSLKTGYYFNMAQFVLNKLENVALDAAEFLFIDPVESDKLYKELEKKHADTESILVFVLNQLMYKTINLKLPKKPTVSIIKEARIFHELTIDDPTGFLFSNIIQFLKQFITNRTTVLTKEIFIIKNGIGLNDLSYILELNRLYNNELRFSDLEKLLPSNVNQFEIENVILSIHALPKELMVTIEFEYNNKAWKLEASLKPKALNVPIPWKVQASDVNTLHNNFKHYKEIIDKS